MLESRTVESIPCPDCGTEVATHFLICPGCHRLVHAESLKRLADEATASEAAGDWTAAMVAWRSALELLPPVTRQHETITRRISDLGRKVDANPREAARASKSNKGLTGAAAGLGTIGLMIWKFKFAAVLILTKGKFLLLGLTKASTLLSMLIMVRVYWMLWGWPFAVGLVVTTYIHEMGHIAALARYGIRAGAPMFIPGIGALVRLRQSLSNPREEAQVGLGGPLWGAGSVAACYGLYFATGQLIFAGIARLAAIINLFNLIPIWQLDGGHAFKALSRSQRWLAAAAAASMWALNGETNDIGYTVLLLITIASAYQAGFVAAPKESDRISAAEFIGLLVLLSLATQIPVPIP